MSKVNGYIFFEGHELKFEFDGEHMNAHTKTAGDPSEREREALNDLVEDLIHVIGRTMKKVDMSDAVDEMKRKTVENFGGKFIGTYRGIPLYEPERWLDDEKTVKRTL